MEFANTGLDKPETNRPMQDTETSDEFFQIDAHIGKLSRV